MEDVFEDAVLNSRAVDLTRLESKITATGEEIVHSLLADWTFPGTDARFRNATLETFADHMATDGSGADLIDNTAAALIDLLTYETRALIRYLRDRRRMSALGDVLFRRPGRWMAEAKATVARLQSEVKLDKNETDARTFGLSATIKPDFLYAVTLVGDIKSGTFHDFYESVATGYAIFAEHALGTRINTAAILAIDLDLSAGKIRSHKVVLVAPTNEQRMLWVTRRDSALKIVRSEAPPPHPADTASCYPCPYRTSCWERGNPGEGPVTPTPAQRPAAAKVAQTRAADVA